jgi:hypothetical protein
MDLISKCTNGAPAKSPPKVKISMALCAGLADVCSSSLARHKSEPQLPKSLKLKVLGFLFEN